MNTKKRWYQSVSNWLMLVACLILVPILIMNLSILFQANTNEDKVPSIFGYKPFIVLSGSMETDIKVGDLIITKNVDPTTLGIGDVIAFRDPEGTITTHRIIEMVECYQDTCFITKGDNNSSQDQQLVELSDVEGIYVGRIPQVGNILNSLSEPTTIIVVVLGITVIFAVAFMISNKKNLSQEQLEFLEYKKQKEMAEREKEDAEFLEFKRQKELKEKEAQKKETKTATKSSAKVTSTKAKKEDAKTSGSTKKTTSTTKSKKDSK